VGSLYFLDYSRSNSEWSSYSLLQVTTYECGVPAPQASRFYLSLATDKVRTLYSRPAQPFVWCGQFW